MDNAKIIERALLIAEYTLDEVVDISLVGSELFGAARPDSDIDVLIWVETPRYKEGLNCRIDGRRLSVAVRPIAEFSTRKMFGKFLMPKKSLLTGEISHWDDEQINGYLQRRGRTPVCQHP